MGSLLTIEDHVERWSDCVRCPLSLFRKQVVHYRGYIPATILFYGMAPGISEDVIGEPMVGPTKDVLDRLTRVCNVRAKDCCYANAVGCRSSESSLHNRDPTYNEIHSCKPRVNELMQIVSPKLIILLGKIAAIAKPTTHNGETVVATVHPAAILRSGGCTRFNKQWRQLQYDTLRGLKEIGYVR